MAVFAPLSVIAVERLARAARERQAGAGTTIALRHELDEAREGH